MYTFKILLQIYVKHSCEEVYQLNSHLFTTDNQFIKKDDQSICNGDFNLESWSNTDANNLLNNLRRTVQISELLVDPLLRMIPSLRTITASFSCSDSESWQVSELSFHFKILFLCASDQVSTYLLHRFILHLVRGILIR